MALSKSVQFRGIDNAVKAYENMEIPRWGLFQGSQFLMKYAGNNVKEGAELLDQYLNALDQRSADGNTYTLCIYDTAEKINSATKYDASFNFRLVDNIEGYQQNKIAGFIETRIAGIEEKLNKVLQPDQDEPEELTTSQQIWATVAKIIEHPQIQQAIAQKILGVIDGIGNTVNNVFRPGTPAAIGSAPVANQADENAKLQEAVNILVSVDPQLGTNLLKIAKVAAADPAKYQQILVFLNLL